MAGRPRLYSEEQLIDRSTEVFWSKGYNAASAQDLMKAMDIGQGSFYSTFKGGKMELYRKSLTRFLEKSIKQFHRGLEQSEDPVQFIRNFFHAIPRRGELEKKNGCYLGNAIVELTNLDDATSSLSVTLLDQLKDAFAKALTDAQKTGKLGAEKSPELLALHLINLWNGINITQRMAPNNTDMRALIDLNLQLLE